MDSMLQRTFRLAVVGLLICAGVLVLHGRMPAEESGFDKFKQKIEEIRPKGKLLRQLLGKEETEPDPNDKAAQAPSQSQSQVQNPWQSPAPVSTGPRPSQSLYAPNSQPTPAYRNPTAKVPSAGSVPLAPQPAPARTARSSGANAARIEMGVATQPHAKGLQVMLVKPESPADKAGIKPGDILTDFAGLPIENEAEINGISDSLQAGDQVELKFLRAGKQQETMVTFGDSDEGSAPAALTNPLNLERADQSSFQPQPTADIQALQQTVQQQQQTIRELQLRLQAVQSRGR
jgi:hypothetical protein